MGEQAQETVTQKAGDGKRYAQLFSRREHQPDVLLAEWCREACRLEFSIDDQPAIGLIDRSAKQRRGEHIEILVSIDAALTHKRNRLAEGFDNRSDQEIAAEFHEIGGLGRLGDNES